MAAQGNPITPETLPCSLTKQVPAGDAPLGDGGFHGTDRGGEDVGLLEDLGQLGTVQGAEGSGIVLLGALVELQHSELVAPGLGIPVLVLQREGAAGGIAAGPTGQNTTWNTSFQSATHPGREETTQHPFSSLLSLLAFRVVFSRLPKVHHKKQRILKILGNRNNNS